MAPQMVPTTMPHAKRSTISMNVDPFDVPRPDPAILVAAKEGQEQQQWVAGISAGLAVSTAILVAVLSAVENGMSRRGSNPGLTRAWTIC